MPAGRNGGGECAGMDVTEREGVVEAGPAGEGGVGGGRRDDGPLSDSIATLHRYRPSFLVAAPHTTRHRRRCIRVRQPRGSL